MSEGTRASIFDADDFDISEFAPRPKSVAPRADKEALREIAEKKGFTSREPSKVERQSDISSQPVPSTVQRRYRTGRNRQLNLKVSDETLNRFYALADSQDLILGEAFEQAVAALEILVARNEAPPRPKRVR